MFWMLTKASVVISCVECAIQASPLGGHFTSSLSTALDAIVAAFASHGGQNALARPLWTKSPQSDCGHASPLML